MHFFGEFVCIHWKSTINLEAIVSYKRAVMKVQAHKIESSIHITNLHVIIHLHGKHYYKKRRWAFTLPNYLNHLLKSNPLHIHDHKKVQCYHPLGWTPYHADSLFGCQSRMTTNPHKKIKLKYRENAINSPARHQPFLK